MTPDEEAAAIRDAEDTSAVVHDLIDQIGVRSVDLVRWSLARDDGDLQWLLEQIAKANPTVAIKARYGKQRELYEVADAVAKMRVQHEARQRFNQSLRSDGDTSARLVAGGSFIHDLPEDPPCLWGTGGQVVWASGEALMLVGTPGVGKTTIAGQVLRARLIGGEVLGMEVVKTESHVLYLAMDRPAQIGRALARQLRDVPRDVLDARLKVWRGPPPADLATEPELMLQMARDAEADSVFVDSLKDAALGLSEDAVGAGYNRARQHCLANGVEVFELHHMKKAGNGKASRPTELGDVYGSTWLTSGAGSVVLLHGSAGDAVVDWRHLKQPAEPVGPFVVEHDHFAGVSAIYDGTDPYDDLRRAGPGGMTVKDFAAAWLGTTDPTTKDGKNAIAKARRKLDAYVRAGKAVCVDPGERGGTGNRPARFAIGDPFAEDSQSSEM